MSLDLAVYRLSGGSHAFTRQQHGQEGRPLDIATPGEVGLLARPVDAPFRRQTLEPGRLLDRPEADVRVVGHTDVLGVRIRDAGHVQPLIILPRDVLAQLAAAGGAPGLDVDEPADLDGQPREEGGVELVARRCRERRAVGEDEARHCHFGLLKHG